MCLRQLMAKTMTRMCSKVSVPCCALLVSMRMPTRMVAVAMATA